MSDDAGVIRGRSVLLLAGSTLLSVALAVAVNVATGGSLPEPFDGLQWLAWPLVAALAGAVVAIAVWEAGADDPAGDGGTGSGTGGRITVRPAELPPGATRFAGRQDDFDALLAAVPDRPVAGLGSPVVLGVFGAGGMGKTVLATQLAHAVASRYPDGQVFVELRGASAEPTVAGEVLRRVLQAFGVAAADIPEDLGARQALYRSVLADRRVLIYLDDAGDEAQVRALMPAATGCLVLVTARPSLYGIGLTAWRDLDALSEPAALALLQAISGATDRLDAEPEATTEVMRLCGYLPLALSIAAARLRTRPRWTVADLASRLSDERRRLDELHIGNQDVRASIRVSYTDLDPVAGRLFRLLSVIGHTSFGPGVAGALLGGFDHWRAAEVALERLADVKLVEITGARRYVLHDLVRIFAQEQLEAEEPSEGRREALLRALRYYRERTEEQWRDLADPSADESRRSDAEGWFARSRPAIVAAVRRAVDAGEPALACEIATAATPYLESRAYSADLATMSTAAVEAARSTGDRPVLARALRNLGQSERHRARHDEALAAFTESLAVWRELGQKGPEAQALRRIGSTHRDAGRLDEAEGAYLRSIAIFEALGERREAAIV